MFRGAAPVSSEEGTFERRMQVSLSSLVPRPHPRGGKGSGELGPCRMPEEVGHDAYLRRSHMTLVCNYAASRSPFASVVGS